MTLLLSQEMNNNPADHFGRNIIKENPVTFSPNLLFLGVSKTQFRHATIKKKNLDMLSLKRDSGFSFKQIGSRVLTKKIHQAKWKC